MRSTTKQIVLYILVAVAAAGGLFYALRSRVSAPAPGESPIAGNDYKNIAYLIDGASVKLVNGASEVEAAPGSASKIITRYFGNEARTDLDGDGREDIAFLLTQNPGGSGTFFYVVAALNKETGWIGSDGFLLGDRIAPQTTEVSRNPNQKGVIVMNYADRRPGEPMTAQPSVGKSVWLKLDPATMQWGEVAQNFEGESANGIRGVTMLGPICPDMKNPPEEQCADKPYKTSLVITTADQARVIKTVTTDDDGKFSVELPPGTYAILSAAAANISPYCSSRDAATVKAGSYTDTTVYCDTGIR